MDRRFRANGKIDYLADPRLSKLTFASIQKHIEATCVSRGFPAVELKKKLFGCATKFALVSVADEFDVELETLLNELGPIKTFTPVMRSMNDVKYMEKHAAEKAERERSNAASAPADVADTSHAQSPPPRRKAAPANVTDLEGDLKFMDRNSRMIGAFGLDVIAKMVGMKVLIVGCKGIGIEVAKNTVLAGVHTLTIFDPAPTSVRDLGTNFFLTEADVASHAPPCAHPAWPSSIATCLCKPRRAAS